jgi:hypothetical protein
MDKKECARPPALLLRSHTPKLFACKCATTVLVDNSSHSPIRLRLPSLLRRGRRYPHLRRAPDRWWSEFCVCVPLNRHQCSKGVEG